MRSAATYWSTRSPQFAGAGGHATYAVLELAGGTDSARAKNYQAIEGRLSAPGLSTQVGGQVPTMSAINKQVTGDIGRAEGISMPLLLILLLVIFGSLAAASPAKRSQRVKRFQGGTLTRGPLDTRQAR